ncbi:hypothetical protein BN844_4271 [Pseudomonas sp. SHC52]|nr:hypothetical protein BN844_4271 [Pseudomonas sp. SHC52]
MGRGGDLGVGIFQQLVTTVEALVPQAEHIGLGPTVDHVQPLLARIDEDVLYRLGHLRQIDTRLLAGDFTGHHVFFAGDRQHLQLGAAGASDQQGRIGGVEADMLQRRALLVQGDRRFAVRVFDRRTDGLFAVRVADLIGVTEYQGLAIGQTDGYQRAARLVFANGRHAGTGRHRQVDASQLGTAVDVVEQRLALVGNPHGDLILFFDGDHQRLAGVLHPGRCNAVFGRQVRALEQRQHHVGQEKEDQGDGSQDGKATDQDVPAGQAVLQRTDTALALQLRRIEINALGRGSRSHCGIGQIIHAHTLAILYDRKMTMQ